jgi:hypothetical protein
MLQIRKTHMPQAMSVLNAKENRTAKGSESNKTRRQSLQWLSQIVRGAPQPGHLERDLERSTAFLRKPSRIAVDTI